MRERGKVYGPYEDRKGHRVVIKEGGSRSSRVFATEAAAQRYIKNCREAFEIKEVTVADLLASYLGDVTLTHEGTRTIEEGVGRMFPDAGVDLLDVTVKRARKLYQALRNRPLKRTGSPVSVATHQESVKACRRLWKWGVQHDIVDDNPWLSVALVGKRNRGKKKLTRDQARTLVNACLASDERDATVVLCCLVLGLRASEVAAISPDCLDDGGHTLIVPGTKTEGSEAPIELPEMLVERVGLLARDNVRDRRAVTRAVAKWCELAGVPPVCPHGLRGTHATLARSAGATGAMVAAQLRHSEAVTKGHYLAPGADRQGRIEEGLRVLDGGKAFRNRSAG